MRVVSYIRMSTARQEASPEQQRAAIAAHAKKAQYKIGKEYADLGASGDNAAKRPQFRQMIADGAAGKFDRIVVYDRSRFGRFDAIEFGRWVSPLRDAGVELETLAEGVESWEDFGGRIIGLVAQEAKHSFLIDLSRAVTRGMVAKAESAEGYSNPTPFGYDRSTTVVGNRRRSVLTINEQQAAIVREIFETYNAPSGSLAAVAEMLNTRGVPPIRGGRWRRNTIGRILQNEAYIGVSAWGRRQKGRYHSRGPDGVMRRKRGAKTEFVDPIRHEGAVPAKG